MKTMGSHCTFCDIVAGTEPATVLYEDDMVMAFEDWNPQMPVHTLIIPKEHYTSLESVIPEEVLGHLMATVKIIAKMKGVSERGYRVIINTGDDARQTVHHLHVHVMGGGRMVGGSPRHVPGRIHREME